MHIIPKQPKEMFPIYTFDSTFYYKHFKRYIYGLLNSPFTKPIWQFLFKGSNTLPLCHGVWEKRLIWGIHNKTDFMNGELPNHQISTKTPTTYEGKNNRQQLLFKIQTRSVTGKQNTKSQIHNANHESLN